MALVTITSNLGSEGIEIARRAADELNVDLYDDNRLQQEAVKTGFSTDELKSLDEKKTGIF